MTNTDHVGTIWEPRRYFVTAREFLARFPLSILQLIDADRRRIGILQSRTTEIWFMGIHHQALSGRVQSSGPPPRSRRPYCDVSGIDDADLPVFGTRNAARDAAAIRHDRGDSDLRLSESMERSFDLGIHLDIFIDARPGRLLPRPFHREIFFQALGSAARYLKRKPECGHGYTTWRTAHDPLKARLNVFCNRGQALPV
jgi:hypothetical protein